MGTARWLFPLRVPPAPESGIGPSSAESAGWDGAAVVVRARGKPEHMAKLRRLTRRWITLSESRGSEGEASGSPALPRRESARGQQHGGKAWSTVKALMVLPCKARVIRRSPD
jgi:hypothetical protein